MSNAYRFDTLADRHAKIVAMIETLNLDLRGLVDLLDARVEAEEKASGIFDPLNPNYSGKAQRLRGRRQNLIAAILSHERATIH